MKKKTRTLGEKARKARVRWIAEYSDGSGRSYETKQEAAASKIYYKAREGESITVYSCREVLPRRKKR